MMKNKFIKHNIQFFMRIRTEWKQFLFVENQKWKKIPKKIEKITANLVLQSYGDWELGINVIEKRVSQDANIEIIKCIYENHRSQSNYYEDFINDSSIKTLTSEFFSKAFAYELLLKVDEKSKLSLKNINVNELREQLDQLLVINKISLNYYNQATDFILEMDEDLTLSDKSIESYLLPGRPKYVYNIKKVIYDGNFSIWLAETDEYIIEFRYCTSQLKNTRKLKFNQIYLDFLSILNIFQYQLCHNKHTEQIRQQYFHLSNKNCSAYLDRMNYSLFLTHAKISENTHSFINLSSEVPAILNIQQQYQITIFFGSILQRKGKQQLQRFN